MIYFCLFFIFLSVSLFSYLFIPWVMRFSQTLTKKRQEKLSKKIEGMYIQTSAKQYMFFYIFAPVIFAAIGFALTRGQQQLIAVGAGILLGIALPSFIFSFLSSKRKKQFYEQLTDALMMMNSSLKGGLSLLQSMEVVADEMPPPISQEFSILIGENKMGVALETSFDRLYKRMGSAALQQFISAVLLARETGGNLPVIFNRIIGTIRENRKIQQNIETLTLQGKIQGVVMSLLPVGFGLFVYHSTPEHFQIMIDSEIGRTLLIVAAVLQVAGAFLIIKFSTIKEF